METSLLSMANAVRALSVDAVERARSGHAGLPLGMADTATILWTEFLKHYPEDPNWPDRDRFVLSAGHGSMLLYALMHLTGYESISLDDIKNFRQLGSNTPGHPENSATLGVETTTGPLGQGLANAVGMAIAEKHLKTRFSRHIVDHRIWVVAGDGCLMEGISQEVITLAGHLKLSNLVVLFDDNEVTIDGGIELTDSTDQCARFKASGWATRRVRGHDEDSIRAGLRFAIRTYDKPVMLAIKTRIGYGAPSIEGTGKAHGGPYGQKEVAGIRKNINWPYEPFDIPEDIRRDWKNAGMRCAKDYEDWRLKSEIYDRQSELESALAEELPEELSQVITGLKKTFSNSEHEKATRVWSGAVLEKITEIVPQMVGGSADLTGSNNTRTSHTAILDSENYGGRFIHYGIREHGMAAAMNGMALHGGLIPYSGTFFTFSDYSRAAIRLSALMGCHVINVMTHDSIGLGEDGPTHQPVEHLASLRAMPNMHVFRPCDGVETAECWELALRNSDGPSTIVLTRQSVPNIRKSHVEKNLCAQGGYVLSPASGEEIAVLIATGSEVQIAMQAQSELKKEGKHVRVVSMPCFELFEKQSEDYRKEVLGGNLPKLAIEAGVRFGWDRWIGNGAFVGMESFGASAPYKDLFEYFNINSQAVLDAFYSLDTA